MTNLEVKERISKIITEKYDIQTSHAIPTRESLTFANSCRKLEDVVVVYIDMRKSRNISMKTDSLWGIRVHKAFLTAIVHAIQKNNGTIRSFNGDGILAFFKEDKKSANAIKAVREINGYVIDVINPILQSYGLDNLDFGAGIDKGDVYVAKTGKSGEDFYMQDLIWIGSPIYKAVELSELGRSPYKLYTTFSVQLAAELEDRTTCYSKNDEYMWDDLDGSEYTVQRTNWYTTHEN